MAARIIVLLFSLLIPAISFSQDTLYARHIIDTLTSKTFFGRGYSKNGINMAMNFLEDEFKIIGLTPMKDTAFIQHFSFPVNTFPEKVDVRINNKRLKPGYDFIIEANSHSLKGNFLVKKVDSLLYIGNNSKLKFVFEDKLTARVSKTKSDSVIIRIKKGAITDEFNQVQLNIENRFIPNFHTGNICGYVKGKMYPDSFIIFSAHYDHLGGIGKETFFPGANDNASGISLLLGLAKWYAKHPENYSIGFIAFSGEEAGLVGSEYFINNPLVPLEKIRFLLNLDLTGTGVDGITVVNSTEFKKEFAILKEINEKKNYFLKVGERGKAKNSDHYWFTEKGVPSFFIYTLGGIQAYHDVYDISATLPNDHYIQLFSLLNEFVRRITDD